MLYKTSRLSPARPAAPLAIGCTLMASLLLGACSGGSGDSGGNGGGTLIPDGGSQTPASDVGTDEIVQNASRSVSASIDANLGGMQAMLSDATADDTGDGTGGITDSLGPQLDMLGLGGIISADGLLGMLGLDGGGTNTGGDPLTDDSLTDQGGTVSDTLFGLDATGTASDTGTVTREGDVITIDPDDARLCADLQLTLTDCEAIAAEVLVVIDAVTEDTGVIHYQYASQDVLQVGYAPMKTSAEVSLGPLLSLMQAVEAADPAFVESGLPESMTGAVRWSAEVLNDAEGQEAGSADFSVTSAVSISDNAGNDYFTVAPSDVLSVSFDAATGVADLDVGLGAVQAVFSMADEFAVEGEQPTVIGLSMNGATANLSYAESTETIQGTNVGLANAPFVLSMDGQELMRVSVQTFGFTASGLTGELLIDTPLSIDANAAGAVAGASSNFSVSAPAGTGLLPVNDVTQVTQGGPLSVAASFSDGAGGTSSDSVVISAGECFWSSDGTDDSTDLLTVGACP